MFAILDACTASDSCQDFDLVNVEFEFFNFDPEIDFHGVKSLLRQLLDVDAPLFDISGLADLILAQHTIGSTVKVDDKGNDAYAFLTCLNLREHRDKKPLADLIQYLSEKASTSAALAPLPDLLASDKSVGLVLAERLVNMPSEVAPPMYGMLLDEIEAAVEDGEPYQFSHYLVLSKRYQEVASLLADDDTEGGARRRKKARDDEELLFYFHPEDEVLQRHAAAHGAYPFTNDGEAVADSRRAFQDMGIRAQGSLILIEAGKFQGAVDAVKEYLSPS